MYLKYFCKYNIKYNYMPSRLTTFTTREDYFLKLKNEGTGILRRYLFGNKKIAS